MGEIFSKSVPKQELEWTGERLTSGAGGEVEVEHLHRYLLARELCRGLEVMDIASGEGYGSSLLAQTAKRVRGVELSARTVEHAQREYATANLGFEVGDARTLPAADASLDVVVSFETLEHFYEHELFFAEVRRVLRPSGFLLVSTPDLNVYSPASAVPNPYHVRELTYQEFDAALRSNFPEVAILGQRMLAGSVIGNTRAGHHDLVTFERRDSTCYESSQGVSRAKYLIGVASMQALPAFATSVYVESSSVEKLFNAAEETALLRTDNQEVRAELVRAADYVRKVEADAGATQTALEEAQGHCASIEAQLDAMRLAVVPTPTHSDQQFASQVAALHGLQDHCHSIERSIREKDAAIGVLKRHAGEREAEFNRQFQQASTEAGAALAAAESAAATVHAADTQALHLAADALHGVSDQLHAVSDRLQGVLASRSWRSTRPLRALSERFPRVRAFASQQFATHPRLRRWVRGGAKVAWWTATLQLGEKLASRKMRIDASAAAAAAAAAVPLTLASNDADAEAFEEDLPAGHIACEIEARTELALSPKQLAVEEASYVLEAFLDSGEHLSLQSDSEPVISVLIIAWNSAYFTLKCLRALDAEMRRPDAPPFEVIVFDNASTDRTAELLAVADGVRVINSATNVGFLLGCNEGAVHARGEALLLLNSDAFVRPDALRCALEALRCGPDVGAVGGRLVLTDGFLQEAGSIVWSDASTFGYCRNMPAESGEAMFRREVDYCSGAFLLTPLTTWRALGGFDVSFAPAYYEEVDYCLRLRDQGLSVLYEPRACVDHYEFGSERKNGDAELQSIINQKKLRAKHAARIRASCLPPAMSNVLLGRTAGRQPRGRLLIIDNEVPFESLGAGYPRAKAIVNAAADDGWDVTFFSLHNPRNDWIRCAIEFRANVEFAVEWTILRLAEFLQERHGYYDVAIVSRPDNMKAVSNVLGAHPQLLRGTRLIYDAEALFSRRDLLEAQWLGKTVTTARQAEAEEVGLAHLADAVICVSEAEAAVFRSHLKVPVEVISHPVVCTQAVAPFETRQGFLFVGRLLEPTAPNWIGLAWFIREVWPYVRHAMNGATLDIVGHVATEHFELTGPGVRVLGPIDELSVALDAARVLIAPIHFAAGIPLKILEAAAAGLPVVGTRLMAEQLGWSAPDQIRAENTPAAFARCAVQLHDDPHIWAAQSAAAQAQVASQHTAASFAAGLSRMLALPQTLMQDRAEMAVA